MWRQAERGDLICGVLLRKSIANLCIDFLLPVQNEAAMPKILLTGNILRWNRQTTCEQLNSCCNAAREHHGEVKSSTALKMVMSKATNNMSNSLWKVLLRHHSFTFPRAVSKAPVIYQRDLCGPAAAQKLGTVEAPLLSQGMSSSTWEYMWAESAHTWAMGNRVSSGEHEMSSSAPWWRLNCLEHAENQKDWKRLGFFWPSSQLCYFQVWWKGR